MKSIQSNIFRFTIILFFFATIVTNVKAEVYNLNNLTGDNSYLYDSYTDNMNEVFYINTGTFQTINFNYFIDVEGDDYVYFYNVADNDAETLIYAGTNANNIGSISTTIPNGKAKVVIQTSTSFSYYSGYTSITGFAISYAAVNATFTSTNFLGNNNVTIAGNLGIGIQQPQAKLHINGSIRGSSEQQGALSINTEYGTTIIGVRDGSFSNFNTSAMAYKFDKPVYASTITGENYITFTTLNNGISRMFVSSVGNVGIGTTSPNQKLCVNGNTSLVSTGTTSIESFNGLLMLTKPAASGQFINLSKTGASTQWSIGTVYNTNNFAIGQAKTSDASFTAPPFVIKTDGKVGIGTTNPQFALDVKGTIRAAEVKVVSIGEFADYVFENDYNLPKLTEVHKYIKSNGHLPEIPSASEVKENGINLVEMQVKLLKKIEELTLYVIEQQQQLEGQKNRIKELEQRLGK